jgi:hypothetical protein
VKRNRHSFFAGRGFDRAANKISFCPGRKFDGTAEGFGDSQFEPSLGIGDRTVFGRLDTDYGFGNDTFFITDNPSNSPFRTRGIR